MEIENQWQKIPIAERDKVYGIFHKMESGEVFELSKVRPENKEKFIIIAKYFIKWNEGISFQMTFNNDYTKIKKN